MATDFKVYQADIEIRLIDLASDKLYDLEEVVKSTIKAIEPRISTLADTINSVSRAFDKLESSIDVYKELDKLQSRLSETTREMKFYLEASDRLQAENNQLRDSMSDLNREAQQSTNIWGDNFFEEATQGAQRADSEFTELKDTMQEISKTVSKLGDDFYRSIYAGASGRSATQVPLEDVRKIQRQLQEEMSKFGTDINLNTFRQALNSTALYFDKDLNFMVKVLTTNKAAFRDEWRNMAADGIDAMEFLYDKLVYNSIVPDGNRAIVRDFSEQFGKIVSTVDRDFREIISTTTDASQAIKSQVDQMTVAFRAMQNIHGQANRDLINSYIKRREFIESGKINEVKLTPKMSLEESGFGEEFRAEFLKAVDWAQKQMNERLGDDQSVGRLLDQWTLEGQAAGKVVVRALQEQGDATANAVRDASIKAIAAMADAEGNLKLYRAQSKERSSLFAIGESFSLSPFGATVGGAYGGWSPESLENIDHLIELTVKLSDVVAALGNDTEKGMLAAGSASEVIADLTSILKDVASLDGLHVDYDQLLPDHVKIIKIGDDFERLTGDLRSYFDLVEHGTQIQELPAESLHGVEAAVKDTVSLLPTLNDVSEAVEKVGTTLVSAFTKPDKALEHASESIQEFGNDSEVVAKGINDILKDYIGYIGAKNPEIARVVTAMTEPFFALETGISKALNGLVDLSSVIWKKFAEVGIGQLQHLYVEAVGRSIIPDLVRGIIRWLQNLADWITENNPINKLVTHSTKTAVRAALKELSTAETANILGNALAKIIAHAPAKTASRLLVDTLRGTVKEAGAALDDKNFGGDFIKDLLGDIDQNLKTLLPKVEKIWYEFTEIGITQVKRLYDVLVGHSIIPDLVNKSIGHFNRMKSSMLELFDTMDKFLINSKTLASSIDSTLKTDKFSKAVDNVNVAFTEMKAAPTSVAEKVDTVTRSVNESKAAVSGLKEIFTGTIAPAEELKERANAVAAEVRAILTSSTITLPKHTAAYKQATLNVADYLAESRKAAKVIEALQVKSTQGPLSVEDMARLNSAYEKFNHNLDKLKTLSDQIKAGTLIPDKSEIQLASAEVAKLQERMEKIAPEEGLVGSVVGLRNRIKSASGGALETVDTVRNEIEGLATSLNDIVSGSFVTKLTGMRQLFFGLGESSNIFAQGLDKVVSFLHVASRAENDFAAGAEIVAQSMFEQSVAMKTQLDDFTRSAKASGILREEFSDLTSQAAVLVDQWARVVQTIQSGGVPTEGIVSVVRQRTKRLQEELRLLRESGKIDLLDDVQLAMLQQFESQMDSNERAIINVTQRMRDAQTATQEWQSSIFSFAGIVERTMYIIKKVWIGGVALLVAAFSGGLPGVVGVVQNFATKIIGSFRHLFDVLVGHSIVPDMILEITKWFTSLPGRIAGVMSKLFRTVTSPFTKIINFIKWQFQNVFQNITWTISLDNLVQEAMFQIREVVNQFFEVNNLIESTEATLKGMIESFSGVDAEKAVKGFFDFVKNEAKTTPFTLSEAVEQSLRLVSFGFDPQDWLRPVANAAAAIGKPMDQLSNAMLKLSTATATSMGEAVMLLREFGINTREASGWVNTLTGQVLTYEEAQEAATLTTEQAAQRGWKQLSFETERAAGSVENAKLALQAYLVQEARFAKAAEARSKTFQGILSNISDLGEQLLIAFGQPVMDALTDVFGQILEESTKSQASLEAWAKAVGEYVADGIYYIFGLYNRINEIFANLQDEFAVLVAFIRSIFRGDWQDAWNIFSNVALSGIDYLLDVLNEYLPQAVDWGIEFVTMIAEGLMDAASWVLREAVESIGDIISSFLEPGSPPEQGPLSNIDTWGQGLMNTFLSSFKDADFDILSDILSPLEDVFTSEEGFDIAGFKNLREQFVQLISGINETGQIDETVWQQIEANLGNASQAVRDYIRAQIDLKKIQKEVADAEEAGFVPEELKQRLEIAQNIVEFKKQDVDLENKLVKETKATSSASSEQDYKAKYEEEKDFIEKKYKLGLLSEEEYLSALARLEENYVDEALKAGETEGLEDRVKLIQGYEDRISEIKEAAKERDKQSAQEIYEEEVALLKWKLDNGLIDHEEYTRGLLAAEERYVEASHKEGVVAGLDSHIRKIKELRGEIDLFEEDSRKKTPSDVFEDEMNVLEQRYRLGIINEQEYLAEKIKLNEKYRDAIIENQIAGKEEEKELLEQGLEEFVKDRNRIIVGLQQDLEVLQAPIAEDTTTEGIFTRLADSAGEIQTELSNSIAGFWTEVDKVVQTSSTTISDSIGAKFNTLVQSIKKELFGEGEDSFGGGIKTFFQPLIDVANWFNTTGQPMIEGWFSSVQTGATEAKGVLDSIWEFFFGTDTEESGLMKVWNSFVDSVKQWITGIGLGLLAYFPLLASLLQPVVNVVKFLLGQLDLLLGKIISPAIQQFVAKLISPIVRFVQFILSQPLPAVIESIVSSVGRLLSSIVRLVSFSTIFWTVFVIGIIENKDKLVAIFDDLVERLRAIFGRLGQLFGADQEGGGFFGSVITGIINYVSNIISGVSDLITGGLFAPIGEFFNGFFDIIYGSIQQLLAWINIFIGFGALLTGNFDLAQESFRAAFDTFREAFSNILASIPEMLAGIVDLVPRILLSILASVAEVFGLHGVAEWLRMLRENVSLGIQEFFGSVAEKLRAIVEYVFSDENWSYVSNFITNLFGRLNILEIFQNLRNEVQSSLGPALTRLGESFTKLQTVFGELWASISEKLAPVFEKLGEVFGKILENIPLWELLKSILIPIAVVIAGALTAALALLIGILDGLARALTFVVDGITLIIDGISNMLAGVMTVVSGIGTVLRGLVEGDLEVVKQGIQLIVDGIIQYFVGLGEGIFGFFTATLGSVIGFLWGFIEGFIAPFQALYDTLIGNSIVPDIVNGTIGWFDTMVNGIIGSITTLRDTVLGLFTDIKDGMAEAWEDIGNKLTNLATAARERGSEAWDWVSGLFPGFASGSWEIPYDMPAIVHKGEMIVPANMANIIRSNVGASAGGLGNRGTQMVFNAGAFSNAFPGIKSGKDANGFLDELNRLVNQGTLKGTVR